MRAGNALGRLGTRLVSSALVAANSSVTAVTERGPLPALGARPDPARMARSPQFADGRFHNTHRPRWLPTAEDARATVREMFDRDGRTTPSGPIPLVRAAPVDPEADTLAVTWYGHASSLVEIDGARVLLDPVWSERVSPSTLVGPRRLHAPPHRLDEIGRVDVIVVSHDHYDHLDMETVRALAAQQDAPFVVPLGVGAHLRRWGIAEERIVELDWWEGVGVAGLRLTATPAQHFSGRSFARNTTLWASWVVAGAGSKVFYSGDSGYFDGFGAIGARHGPFDLTLVQVGAYNVSWPDVHMTPEEGIAAHRDVGGGLLVPVHWATFNLAPHPWADPANRVTDEAKAQGVEIAVPRPGERIDVAKPPAVDGWWRG